MFDLGGLLQNFLLSLGLVLGFGRVRHWLPDRPAWVRPVTFGAVLGGAAALGQGLDPLLVALSGTLAGGWAGATSLVLATLAIGLGGGLDPARGLVLLGTAALGVGAFFLVDRLRTPWFPWLTLGLALFFVSWLTRALFPSGQGPAMDDPRWLLSLVAYPLSFVTLGLLDRWEKTRDEDQTAHRRRLLERDASERSVRLILDSLAEAVFIYDLDGRIVDVNRRFLELYELTEREQAVGTSPLHYAAPDNQPDLALDPRSEPTQGRTLQFEWQCQGSRTGRIFSAEVHLTRIDYRGSPHLLAAVRDISGRKASEQQLRAYQMHLEDLARATERLTLATRAANIGIWDWDLKANTMHWDDIQLSLYGVSRQEFSGQLEDCDAYIVPDDLPLLKAKWAESRETGKVLECQHRILRDGQVRHVRCYGQLVRSPEGEPLRMVGINYDVTERVEALKALQDERNLAQLYLDVVEVVLVALDSKGKITLLNRKGYQVLGYPVGSLEGKNWFLTCLPPEQIPNLQTVHRRIMEGRANAPEYYENEVVTSGGQHRLLAWHNILVRDSEGLVVGTLSSGEDITEKRAAERQLDIYSGHLGELVNQRTKELERARDAANAANEAKSLFLANMSHEIRTPMNSVLGFAQLLAKESGLSDEGRHKVETIVRSGEHLLAIINDILEMSRIEAGRLELRFQTIGLRELLAEVAQLYGQKAADKGLVWSFDQRPDLPRHIVTDPVRLRQVLINLVGNAIKFTEAGSVRLTASRGGRDRVVIEVGDTGIGIPAAERERLFQPFERTRSGKAVAGGTGLGLAISRRYAQLLGGDVTIAEGEGPGTLFRFEFDAPEAAAPGKDHDIATDLPVLVPAHQGTLVLVVDDMRANRELLKGMLEPQGFHVLEASDGNEAVRLVDTRSPRVVLMDLLMPGLDGYEATRRIRQSHPRELVTVIGVTASAFAGERSHFESSGLDGFLAKPFRLPDLHDLISRLTDLKFEPHAVLASTSPETPNRPLPPDWTEAFRVALSQGNVTRLRQLGEEARSFDPGLAGWVAERAARYELDELRGFLNSRGGAQ